MNTQTEVLDLKYLEVYAYADLAAGKDAKTRKRHAKQAIVVGARDWLERWYVLLAWAGLETTTTFRDKIIGTQKLYRPRLFGLEANGMQVLFGALVREAARLQLGNIKMISVYQPTNVDKMFRIRTGLEPIITQGRLFVQDDQVDLLEELQGFPTAATVDIVDALESCLRLAPKRPLNTRNNAERDAYARYLRHSQLPPRDIERKLAEFDRERAEKGE